MSIPTYLVRAVNRLRHYMKAIGYKVVQAAEWGLPKDRLDLTGDRDLEWAWVAAQIPEKPGRVLDLGPSGSLTPLVPAFKEGEVIGLDLSLFPVPFSAPGLSYVAGDILHGGLPEGQFDTIINCSTTEHIGLSGRYGSTEDPDGDLKAMALMRERLSGPTAPMVFTIPVGRDSVQRPYHRIYGPKRLPQVLDGFTVHKQRFYAKLQGRNVWQPVTKDVALEVEGSASFYALGLFVLLRP